MKRRVLKDWIEKLIISIQFIFLMLLAGECESTSLFIISKTILLSVFLINHLILWKYTDLFSEVDHDN